VQHLDKSGNWRELNIPMSLSSDDDDQGTNFHLMAAINSLRGIRNMLPASLGRRQSTRLNVRSKTWLVARNASRASPRPNPAVAGRLLFWGLDQPAPRTPLVLFCCGNCQSKRSRPYKTQLRGLGLVARPRAYPNYMPQVHVTQAKHSKSPSRFPPR
jgi:hypothetical protein